MHETSLNGCPRPQRLHDTKNMRISVHSCIFGFDPALFETQAKMQQVSRTFVDAISTVERMMRCAIHDCIHPISTMKKCAIKDHVVAPSTEYVDMHWSF